MLGTRFLAQGTQQFINNASAFSQGNRGTDLPIMIDETASPVDRIWLSRLNKGKREINWGDRSVKLTKKEFDILLELLSASGCVVGRDELLGRVWGPGVHVGGRTVDAHIVRIRRKMKSLSDQAPTIETVWALGYRLKK